MKAYLTKRKNTYKSRPRMSETIGDVGGYGNPYLKMTYHRPSGLPVSGGSVSPR